MQDFLEVPPRFELGNKGFADLCLTTWPCRLMPVVFLHRLYYHIPFLGILLLKKSGAKCFAPILLERITGLEPATFALARRRSTKWAKSACGASGRNRTNDTRIFSPLLYQLSYRGIQQGLHFLKWRPEGDSNPWPLAWQASVLTNWTTGPLFWGYLRIPFWWEQ